jgi:heat-inducible transcriptional repressor
MSPPPASRGSPSRPSLSERDRRILASLVREYIDRGEPVSSLWLAEHSGLGVSSATLRNVLAALEESGYVRQPHTSAGRVPTDLAYRCYVDQLLEGRRPARPAPMIEARIRQAASFEDLFDCVSQELSRSSHHLGFALAFARHDFDLKHVEFVSLEPTRVLVVLVATTGQVVHKRVTVSEPLTPGDLRQAANYLNGEFGGRPVREIRDALAARMQDDRAAYDKLLTRVVELARQSLAAASAQGQLYIHGTSSLVESAPDDEAGASMAGLRALLGMIEEKHRLIELLSAYIDGPGVTVVIGGEHLSPELRGFSLVASTSDDDGEMGAVGIIGPTRMRYSRAITAVDTLAQVLGRVLAASVPPRA